MSVLILYGFVGMGLGACKSLCFFYLPGVSREIHVQPPARVFFINSCPIAEEKDMLTRTRAWHAETDAMRIYEKYSNGCDPSGIRNRMQRLPG